MKSIFFNKPRFSRGFVLYIVMAVLLALSILAFALNNLKQGAVTQLARNVDQNRLTLLATSANNEVLAMLRSNANVKGKTTYNNFRLPFKKAGTYPNFRPYRIEILSNFEPPETKKMATDAGYKLKIKSKVVLIVYRECPYKSVTAYNAYIDLYSQAYRIGREENVIEIHERRDVRLIDLRHRLDKYVLFVKNYCPDYNNTSRRLIVKGITPNGYDISKVYLGNDNYPKCADTQKNIWLDTSFSESKNMPGMARLFGSSPVSTAHFPKDSSRQSKLFYFKKTKFSTFSGVTFDQFTSVLTVKRVYEKFVNEAADGCEGQILPHKIGNQLKAKCITAMAKSNSNAASFKVCDDFKKNANGRDYSNCQVFKSILATCIANWQYKFGYTDAETIWNVNSAIKPNLPSPRKWATALAFCGLATTTSEFKNKGSYFAEYLERVHSKQFNPERAHVGKMSLFFGTSGNTPVLFEGPVYLRFFKVAFLDDFTTKHKIDFGLGKEFLTVEPIPLPFFRYHKKVSGKKSFLNTELGNELSPLSSLYKERYLMSRAVDDISANCLIGNQVKYYNGDGKKVSTNPFTATPTYASYPKPMQNSRTSYSAKKFGRLIDFDTISYNYPNPDKFLAERVMNYNGKKTLFIDGVMYIEKGDLDLSSVNKFYGSGMIYLGDGNCKIGNFSCCRNAWKYGDSVRFYLRKGDFIIKSSSPNVSIEASLAAFYYPPGSPNPKLQGSLICSGKQTVNILGNLLVDYLYTQGSKGSGLKAGGKLIITHDPLIYDPDSTRYGQGSYHVSIAPVKSLYSINSGGKTF